MTKKLKFNRNEKEIVSRKSRKLIKKILDKNYQKRITASDALFKLLIIQQKQQQRNK